MRSCFEGRRDGGGDRESRGDRIFSQSGKNTLNPGVKLPEKCRPRRQDLTCPKYFGPKVRS